MKNDIKLRQKRLWLCGYTKEPIKRAVETVVWVGKTGAVIRDNTGREEFFLFDTLNEETIALSKVKKGLK